MVEMSVDAFQLMRMLIFHRQAVVDAQEHALGRALRFSQFEGCFYQVRSQWTPNVFSLPGCFAEGVSRRFGTWIADDMAVVYLSDMVECGW